MAISLSRKMQIYRSDYATFGAGMFVLLDATTLSREICLRQRLVRNRKRNFFDSSMSHRDWTWSRREEGTRCLIHRIESILQHTENGGYLADRVRSRGGLLAGRGTQPGKCCRAFQELSSAFAVASSAIRGF